MLKQIKTKITKNAVKSGFELDNMVIHTSVKKSKKGTQEVISITPKEGQVVEFTTDFMLNFIAQHFKTKKFAIALADSSVTNVPVTTVERQVYLPAEKDYKQGDVITIRYKHPYPAVLAALEETYKLCIDHKDYKEIPFEKVQEMYNKIGQENKPFVETWYNEAINNPLNKKN